MQTSNNNKKSFHIELGWSWKEFIDGVFFADLFTWNKEVEVEVVDVFIQLNFVDTIVELFHNSVINHIKNVEIAVNSWIITVFKATPRNNKQITALF